MKSFWQRLLLSLLFAAALGVRLFDLDDPPLDFHPARQMHSALMARGFYLNSGGLLRDRSPEYNHDALSRGMQEPWIEPPLYEKLTAALYHVFGSADLRIPRVESIIFWLIGGVLLLIFGRSPAAAAWFLCFPYGVIASRSFQPDIPMVTFLILSVYAVIWWSDDSQSLPRALLAGVCCGCCILIKQVAAFPLGLALAAFCLSKFGLKDCLKNYRIWLLALLSLTPMLAYNYWGCFVDGFLMQQYQGRFYLSELISPAFYIRWIRMIDQVFTVPLAVLAILGIFLLKDKQRRALWLGYLAGYIIYGLCLPHHIGTHNYYQLILFPLIAIGIGSIAQHLWEKTEPFGRTACVLALCGLCFWWLSDSVMTLKRQDFRAWPQRWVELADELETYQGAISTIGIMDDYGGGMTYWGLKNPMIWDENVERLPEFDALVKLNTTFWNYRWLVVTDLPKFYEQPRLQQYLNQNAVLYRQESDYLIYQL